jgi:hypothetical protein
MSDQNVQIGINVKQTNPEAIDQVKKSLKGLGEEAKKQSESIDASADKMSKSLDRVAQGAKNALTEAEKEFAKFSKMWDSAYAENARRDRSFLQAWDDAHKDNARRVKEFSQAWDVAHAENARRAREFAQAWNAAHKENARRLDESAKKAETFSQAWNNAHQENHKRTADFLKIWDQAHAENNRRTKDFSRSWDEAHTQNENRTRKLAKLQLEAFAEDQKRRKQAAAEAKKAEWEEGRSQNRVARSALLPFLGAGANNLGPLGRVAVTAGSFAAGTPGGSYGPVGLLSEASTILSSIGPGAIAATAGAFITVEVLKQLYQFTKESAMAAQELTNLSSRLGLTTAEAEKLKDAAAITGININVLEGGARHLASAIEEPTGAGKRAAESLAKLGIRTRELNGEARESGPVLVEFLEKLSKIPNTTDRIQLASVVLGRGAKELLPLIQNYDKLRQTVKGFEGLAPLDATAKLNEAAEKINELSIAWEKFKKGLATELAPITIKVVTALTPTEGKVSTSSAVSTMFSAFLSTPQKLAQSLGSSAESSPIFKSAVRDPFRAYSRSLAPIFNLDPTGGAYGAEKRFLEGVGGSALSSLDRYRTGPGLPGIVDGSSLAASEEARISRSQAEGFKAKQLGSDEDAISARISELKDKKKELENKLSDTLNPLGRADRPKVDSDFRETSRDLNRLENLLKSIQKAKGFAEEIKRELDELTKLADESEAKNVGDSTVAARRAQLFKNPAYANNPKARAAADVQFARIQASDDAKERAAITERRNGLNNQTALNDITHTQALARQNTRYQFGEEGGADSIAADYRSAINEANQFHSVAITVAADIADKKRRQEAIDIADAKWINQLKDAEYEKEKALLELEHKRTLEAEEQQKKIRATLTSAAKSELGKDFSHAGRLAELRAGFGQGAFGELQAQAQRLQYSRQLYNIELGIASQIEKEDDRKLAQLQAYIDLKSRERDAEREHEIKLAELRKQQIDKVRDDAGKVYDALTTKGFRGIGDILTAQLKVVGRTVFQNVAAEAFKGGQGLGLDRIFGGAAGQTSRDAKGNIQLNGLGRILAGTPFGVDTQKIALQEEVATRKDNTAALIDLSAVLRQIASGTSVSGVTSIPGAVGGIPNLLSGIPGLGGIFSGADPSNPLIMHATGGSGLGSLLAPLGKVMGGGKSLGSFFGGASTVFGSHALDTVLGTDYSIPTGDGTATTAKAAGKLSTASRIGAGVGLGLQVGTGILQAFSGFKQGGAKGIMSGIAGAAGAIAPFTGPAAPFIEAGAAILATVGSLFGTSKEKYQKKLDNELNAARFVAPLSQTRTSDTSGFYSDYNYLGQRRKSTFLPTPQIEQPFIDVWHTGGWLNGTNTYTNIPGGVKAPYTPTSPKANVVVQMNVSTMDAASFRTAAPKIATALHDAIRAGGAESLVDSLQKRIVPK